MTEAQASPSLTGLMNDELDRPKYKPARVWTKGDYLERKVAIKNAKRSDWRRTNPGVDTKPDKVVAYGCAAGPRGS